MSDYSISFFGDIGKVVVVVQGWEFSKTSFILFFGASYPKIRTQPKNNKQISHLNPNLKVRGKWVVCPVHYLFALISWLKR